MYPPIPSLALRRSLRSLFPLHGGRSGSGIKGLHGKFPHTFRLPLVSGFRRIDGAMHRTGSPRMPRTPIRRSPTSKHTDPASVIISSPTKSPSIARSLPRTYLSSPPLARNSVGEPPLCKHLHGIELPTMQRLGRVAYRRLLRYIPPVRNAICPPLNWRRAGQAKGGTINKRLALQRILRATSSVG